MFEQSTRKKGCFLFETVSPSKGLPCLSNRIDHTRPVLSCPVLERPVPVMDDEQIHFEGFRSNKSTQSEANIPMPIPCKTQTSALPPSRGPNYTLDSLSAQVEIGKISSGRC